jgi:hypothetical protein
MALFPSRDVHKLDRRILGDKSLYSSCAQVCVRLSVVGKANLHLCRMVSGLTYENASSNHSISLASAYHFETIDYSTSV